MAAAITARKSGASVAVVDDNPDAGGQIWRSSVPAGWRQQFENSGAQFLKGCQISDAPEPGILRASNVTLTYQKLILATGARELFLPFPGWTLPNAMGAGGLQAMVKGGLQVKGKRVVVAGSGPLLIAVAASLKEHGAKIVALAEQATGASLTGFTAAIVKQPTKIWQGSKYLFALRSVPFHRGVYPIHATGAEVLKQVTLSNGLSYECDYLACGFGHVPNTELAKLLGCQLDNTFVHINAEQQTSVNSVYAAGELTGIGGLEKSLLEGEAAAYHATGNAHAAAKLSPKLQSARRFAIALAKAFALRPELRHLAQPETLICRCEDVPLARLESTNNWREAKLHTRCGMGPCQGRICGPAIAHLKGWQEAAEARPPIFPVSVGDLVNRR
jgi:D-hydroxyproline dehydrogenase subunit alpha